MERLGGVAAITALSAMLIGAQDPPPPRDSDPNIVVTGRPELDGIDLSGATPRLRGGAWQFDRTTTLVTGQPSNAPQQRFPGTGSADLGRPFRFSICLPDDDLEGALRTMAGEGSNLPRNGQRCGNWRLSLKDGRASGRQSCTLMSGGIGRSHSNLHLRMAGRYDRRTLTLNMIGEEQIDGLTNGPDVLRPASYRWQVTGTRLGACEGDLAERTRKISEADDLLFGALVDGTGI